MSNAFLVSLFEHKAWCNRRLVEALAAAPEQVDRAGMAMVLFTLDHTSIVDQIFKAHLLGEPHQFEGVVANRFPVLTSLAETLSQTDAWYIDYAGAITAAEMNTEIEFRFVSDGDQGRMTRGEILAHIITHGASHRGAIGKMIEGLGFAGAPDMVTTFERLSREGAA